MIDKTKIEESVRMFLEGIGEDPYRDGLIDTPDRIARMANEIFAGYTMSEDAHLTKQFATQPGTIVFEKDIDFSSLCEHHMLPFFGKVHIAYIPTEKVVGLSKLSRLVEVYAKRLQIQERMTKQILHALVNKVNCAGAMILIEAVHTCVTLRGVKKTQTKTVTMESFGVFTQPEYQNVFFQMLHGHK